MTLRLIVLATCVIVAGACDAEPSSADSGGAVATDSAACPSDAMRVVDEFGAAMRRVSLLAPDTVVGRELLQAYSGIVTDALLAAWRNDPHGAPGREVSSPWPARIDVGEARMADRMCRVSGDVVYVTSADTVTPVDRRSVTLELTDTTGWRVSEFTISANPARSASSAEKVDSGPEAVLRRYYAAIEERRYDDAYALWSRDGAASGQTRMAFARGFADTRRVVLTVGDSVQMEGAAGSQYATVPVTVDATLEYGTTQRFTGTYTLRRSMVDGATPAQRSWHIESARLSRSAPPPRGAGRR
jgi:hypothetical protein